MQAEITSDPSINYTVDQLTVKISLDYDSQASEYTVVKLFSAGEPTGHEITLQTSDMIIVSQALHEYFSDIGTAPAKKAGKLIAT